MGDPFPQEAFDKAIRAITGERHASHATWGKQRIGIEVWNLVLTEEVGEFAQATLRLRQHLIAHREHGTQAYPGAVIDLMRDMRAEMIQVANVAISTIEQLDEELAEWEQKERDGW